MEGRVRCLGVWLCVCLSVCQVRTLYVPSDMNRTIQNLVDNYVSPPHDSAGPDPLGVAFRDSSASKFPGGSMNGPENPKFIQVVQEKSSRIPEDSSSVPEHNTCVWAPDVSYCL